MCKFKKPEIPANITADERRSLMFNALSSLDLNDKLEKRENDKLSYLSWANAWAEFKAAYPSATLSSNQKSRKQLTLLHRSECRYYGVY